MVEELRVSYKKMNPFCVPFATTNMPRGVFSPFCRIKEDIFVSCVRSEEHAILIKSKKPLMDFMFC
ncbi:hypothetical protein SETIT_7G104700v2 [Setaria italica]|uniref:Uncharacterized protein n=1 Tax=Setaria italica TaxID=4555 RepID=A0A368RVZ2_SETIT|nr:hypothetical protein SETIT_7G104700v2 [Setaria italica]